MKLLWRWRLANGGVVEAAIDGETEIVSQTQQVLSTAPRGSKADGHVVVVRAERPADRSERPPMEAVVTFDPRTPICVLRVEGHEVSPLAWPTRERPPPPKGKPARLQWVLLAALALLAGGGFWLRARLLQGKPRIEGNLPSIHRAKSGLFIAHFDEALTASNAILPGEMDGVVLQDEPKATTIVIATVKPPPVRDPWALHQRLHGEAVANLPKGAGRFEESERTDATCFGEQAAVDVGSVVRDGAKVARVRSCTFVRDGAAYITMSMLAEPVSSADEQRARAIIDATELTRLGELSDSP
jgi:hypothetical protein